MKILRVSSAYPEYINDFYIKNPHLSTATYEEQKNALDLDSFAWANFWAAPMGKLGYEMQELLVSVSHLQKAWWLENFPGKNIPANLDEITVAQVKEFMPEILWFDDHSPELLGRLKAEIPSLKLILGWMGSAIPSKNALHLVDCALSCAPETVARLVSMGAQSRHLNHGFAPEVLERLKPSGLVEKSPCAKKYDFIFIGQIIRANQFHENRAKLVEELCEQIGLTVFSPMANLDWKYDAKINIKKIIYQCLRIGKKLGLEKCIDEIPELKKLVAQMPLSQKNKRITPYLRPPCFGLGMYQTLQQSNIVLNSHADSSEGFASNMRLFETTGVGTCLLTDWKKNLPSFFELDHEIVSYRSHAECVEKAKWLIAHPLEREKIAQAGQRRTLKEHTIEKRAYELNAIIQDLIK